MPRRNNVRVRWEKKYDAWIVRLNRIYVSLGYTKDHAVSRARRIASINSPAELTVYNKSNGQVCIKDTYAGDPPGIKG